MDARNFTFMFYGFAAAWLVIALFLLTLVARERHIRSQIESLKKMLAEKEKK